MLNTRILFLAGTVFVLALGVFLGIARLLEKRRALLERRLRIPSSGTGTDGALDASVSTPPQGWSGRLDNAFNSMIQHSGLEMEPAQALAFIALAGVGLAALLFLWRGTLWLSVLGLTLGSGGTLMVFVVLRNRYRRQLAVRAAAGRLVSAGPFAARRSEPGAGHCHDRRAGGQALGRRVPPLRRPAAPGAGYPGRLSADCQTHPTA